MARLKTLPSQAMVDTLAGAVDFYYWKGIPVARKWPRWPPREPHPLEGATQEIFAYVARMWRYLPPFVQEQYTRMAVSTPVTGRDIFTRAYINASRF